MLDGGAGADLIDGGIGFDTLVFWTATAGVALSLVTGGTGGDAESDVYISIENIYGTPFDDFLEGNDLPNTILPGGGDYNVIRGLGGADHLYGSAGSETFYGGEGNDWISGGGGIDYARYDDFAGRGRGGNRRRHAVGHRVYHRLQLRRPPGGLDRRGGGRWRGR